MTKEQELWVIDHVRAIRRSCKRALVHKDQMGPAEIKFLETAHAVANDYLEKKGIERERLSP